MVGSLLGSFFFLFFFFLLLSALPWSVLLPRSLLGELVHCFLMGGLVDLSWCEEFLGRCLFTLLGSILRGNVLYQGILGQRALR